VRTVGKRKLRDRDAKKDERRGYQKVSPKLKIPAKDPIENEVKSEMGVVKRPIVSVWVGQQMDGPGNFAVQGSKVGSTN
jgi:hypothetical protein